MKNIALEPRLSESEAGAVCSVLVTRLGGSYSRLLGIRLAGMGSEDVFNWFTGAFLLGSPVPASSGLAAYRALVKLELLSPRAIACSNDHELMQVLQDAGFVGYSARVACSLRGAVESLVVDYDADINRLHFFADDENDLVLRLRSLGNGVPRRVVVLFLREMRGVWDKARPGLSSPVIEAARCLGVIDTSGIAEATDQLHSVWEKADQSGRTYADLEAALARLGENYCRMRRCVSCPLSKLCISWVPIPRSAR